MLPLPNTEVKPIVPFLTYLAYHRFLVMCFPNFALIALPISRSKSAKMSTAWFKVVATIGIARDAAWYGRGKNMAVSSLVVEHSQNLPIFCRIEVMIKIAPIVQRACRSF